MVAILGCAVCVVYVATAPPPSNAALLVVLLASAIVANVGAAELDSGGKFAVGGSFTAAMLAAAFLGPAEAVIVGGVAELAAWAYERYRLTALPVSVFAAVGAVALARWASLG